MSTNFYLVPAVAVQSGMDLSWLTKVHLGKRSNGRVMLQALVGEWDNDNTDVLKKQSDYVRMGAPQFSFMDAPVIDTWAVMRSMLVSGEFDVVDEYGRSGLMMEFIKSVEVDPSGAHREMMDYFDSLNPGHYALPSREHHFMDDQGFSFSVSEFF